MPHYENENVPFEVPNSWEWCKIANLGEIVTGTTPSKLVGEYYNGEYPFYKPTDLEQGINTLTSSDSLTLAGLEASRCLPKESILVTCIGATIGKTGVIQREGSCNQQINAIIPYSHSNPLYIYYCIISGFMQNAIKSNASATTLPILNKTDFSNLLFPLPPFDEQKRIVAEVEKWFVLIDEIEAHKSDLQEYIKQAKSKVLDIAIHGKLVPQDPNDEPAIELLKRVNPNAAICDTSHYGNLPESWCICKFKDVFDITMGSSPTGDSLNNKHEGIEFHQGKLCFSELYLNKSEIYTDSPTKIAEKHSILLCVRAPVGVINITEREICIGRGLCSLKPKNGIDYMFAFYALQTHKNHFEANATGTTFKAIGGDTIRNEMFALPPYDEQVRIRKKIESLFYELDLIIAEL